MKYSHNEILEVSKLSPIAFAVREMFGEMSTESFDVEYILEDLLEAILRARLRLMNTTCDELQFFGMASRSDYIQTYYPGCSGYLN